MKSINKIIVVLFSAALVIGVGCKKEEFGELGEPMSKLEGINDTWEISKVIIIDERTATKDERDISSLYTSGSNKLTLSINSSNLSYTVTEGDGKNVFGTGGSWEFYRIDLEKQITYVKDSTGVQLKTYDGLKDSTTTKNVNVFYTETNYPEALVMVPTGADTMYVYMNATVRPIDNYLKLSYTRKDCDGKDYVTYKMTFKRK